MVNIVTLQNIETFSNISNWKFERQISNYCQGLILLPYLRIVVLRGYDCIGDLKKSPLKRSTLNLRNFVVTRRLPTCEWGSRYQILLPSSHKATSFWPEEEWDRGARTQTTKGPNCGQQNEDFCITLKIAMDIILMTFSVRQNCFGVLPKHSF